MARKGNKGRKGTTKATAKAKGGAAGPAVREFSKTMQEGLAFKRIDDDKTLTPKQRLRLKRYTVLKQNGLV